MLSFDAVRSLITEGKFGVYFLYNHSGGELLATGPADEDSFRSTADLVNDLESKMNYLGESDFKIVLKKARSSNGAAGQIVYRFTTRTPGAPAAAAVPAIAMGAVPADMVEARIKAAVEDALAKEREKFRLESAINDLKRELAELKREPAVHPGMAGLMDMGKMVSGIVLAKVAPEAIPMVNAMLGLVEDTDEKDEPRKVERTD